MIDPAFLVRLPNDQAELSGERRIRLTKDDGLQIATTVFSSEMIEKGLEFFDRAEVRYRTITRAGRYLVEQPGIIFDPPLILDELVSVVLIDFRDNGPAAVAWRDFPRVAKPAANKTPTALVTKHPFHERLADPLATAIATDVFGRACLAKVPLMPDGEIMGTLEYSLVVEPGQPVDFELAPPLARGEVIDVCLRAPKPGTRANVGPRGPKRPSNLIAAVAQFPRVKFPLDQGRFVELLASRQGEFASLEEVGNNRAGSVMARQLADKHRVTFCRDAGYG